MPRETGINILVPNEFMPATTAASKSPPCAPTPGANIQISGPAAARAFDKAVASVAPTTSPNLLPFAEEEEARSDHTEANEAIFSYSVVSVVVDEDSCSVNKSFDPGLEVLHKIKAPP
mmetsp:Transcript_12972/g.12615  ORF Transcript_12972/g.12615 Transcript_12972/m.12615 type:complete len:118 (+) Transcript_12972:508-861(+)